MEILCFDHSEMTSEICESIFGGMTNPNLVFLNLSWNLLTGAAVDSLVHVLE